MKNIENFDDALEQVDMIRKRLKKQIVYANLTKNGKYGTIKPVMGEM